MSQSLLSFSGINLQGESIPCLHALHLSKP